jgi:hypothetical protein
MLGKMMKKKNAPSNILNPLKTAKPIDDAYVGRGDLNNIPGNA